MSKQPLPDLSNFDILDNDDLFTIQTPAPKQSQSQQKSQQQQQQQQQQTQSQGSTSTQPKSTADVAVDEASARENALKQELESLQRINQVIEGLRASLEKAKANMETLNTTTSHASHLLQTWTRILSQTEHNQRLILNAAWQGATQDMADAENEVQHRQARERERVAADEERRRRAEEERQRKAEEEERRRAEAASRTPGRSSTRARGGTGARGTATSGTGRGTSAGHERTASAASGRSTGRAAAMQYGRVGSVGTKSARGRGRGVG